MSHERYRAAQDRTESSRQTEYRLFALVTRALMAIKGERSGKRFHEAIDWNRRLWLTLQTDLAADENGLPDELKARLISLSIWVDKHSRRVLRGDDEMEPLIDVNRSIMEGVLGAE